MKKLLSSVGSIERNLRVKLLLISLIASCTLLNTAEAANRFSVSGGTGNWNSTTNWSATTGGSSGASFPVAGDVVVIEGGVNITVNVASACANITVSSGSTLTVNNNITINNGSTVTINGAVVFNSSAFFTGGGGGSNGVGLAINSGASLTTANTAGFVTSSTSAGSIRLNHGNKGHAYNDGVNYTYNGTANQSLGTAFTENTPGDLTINNTGTGGNNTVSLSAASAFSGNLTITAGILDATTSNFNLNVGGTWSNSGTFTARSATVALDGTSNQTINGSSSTTFNSLTLNNSTGATLSTSATVNTTLTLTSGSLNLTGNILTMGSAANAISGTFSATRMIIASGGGEIRKACTSTAQAAYLFPIGDNTSTAEYSPLSTASVAITAGTFTSAYIGVKVTDSKHIDNKSATNFLTRYWSVTQSGITGSSALTATVVGTYTAGTPNGADVSGAEASVITGQLNGTFNQSTNPWIKFSALSSNRITATAATLTNNVTSIFTGVTSAAPSVSATGSGSVCVGGTITLTASGSGDPSFLYSWSNSLGTATTATPSTATPGTTTYTITATDGNGFTATNTAAVTVNALPTPSINAIETSGTGSNDGTICRGASVTLSTNSFNAYLWNTSATTQTISVSPTTTTTYTVTVTNANGCTGSVTRTITVNALPTPTVSTIESSGTASNDGTICRGASATLSTGSFSSYVWNTSAITQTISVSPTTTTSYTVTVTDANGCSAPATGTVNVNALPTPSISAIESSGNTTNDGTICIGGSVTLSTGSFSSYLWSTTEATQTISVSPTATTTYTVTVTDANVCSSSVTRTITVNPLPTPSVSVTETSGNTANDGTICAGASATLNAGSFSSYAWNGGETTQTISVSPTATTTYTVTVVNANGCVNSATSTITVNPLPSAPTITVTETSGTTNDDGTICRGASATLDAGSHSAYAWNTGATTQSINVSPTATTTYTVTISDANGCTASSASTITVNSVSVSVTATETSGNTSNDGIICTGGSVTLDAGSFDSYAWDNSETTQTISVSPTSTTTYTVTVTDASIACSQSATRTITVNPLPAPSIGVTETSGNTANDGTICTGASATLNAGSFASYAWDGGQTTQTISVSPTAITTYTVTVVNANGCVNSTTSTITVNPLPSAPTITVTETSGTTNDDGTICRGASATLDAGSHSAYAWNTGATTQSISVSPTATTTYTVTISDANGCNASSASTITVNPLPIPSVSVTETSGTANNDGTICISASVTLDAGSFSSYAWDNGGTDQTISVSPTVTTTYTVTVTDANVCAASATRTITVNPLPTPSISVTETSGNTANDGTICTGASATLNAGSFSSYAWDGGATTQSISVSPTVTTIYTVTVVNANGCVNSTTTTITVNPLPSAPTITVTETSGTTNDDGTICRGASATLDAGSHSAYAWNTGATTQSINVSPTATTTYTVTISDANGCTASSTSTITVNPLPTPSVSVTETSGTANNDGTICTGASASLDAGSFSAYIWNTGETTQTISVSPTTTTTYTVTVTNSNVCSASATRTITVNTLPAPSIGAIETSGTTNNDGTICTGSSVTLSTTAAFTSYAWNTGATTRSISVSPTTTTTYSITVTNSNGCIAAGTITVTVNPLPTPSISVTETSGITNNDGSICIGASATLNAGSFNTYIWNTGATTSAITVSPTTTTSYTVTVVNSNVCTGSTTTTITVNQLPSNITPTGTGSICSGTSHNISIAGSQSGVNYQLRNNSGNTNVGSPVAGTGGTISLPTGSLGSTTTFNVLATNTTTGCSVQMSGTVTIFITPLPSVSVSGASSICTGTSTVLTASNSGGTVDQTFSGSSGTINLALTDASKAAYTYPTITLSTNNALTLTSTDVIQITINITHPGVQDIDMFLVDPSGTKAMLLSSDNGGGGNNYTGTILRTDLSNVIGSSGNNSAPFSNPLGYRPEGTITTAPVLTGAVSGDYSAVVPASALNGANIDGAWSLRVWDDNSGDVGTLNSWSLSIIRPSDYSTVFTGPATIGSVSYSGTNNASAIATVTPPTGTNTYTITTTDGLGCTNSATKVVTVNALPTPSTNVTETSGTTSNDGTICRGASVTIGTTAAFNGYAWSTGATTSTITVSPTVTTTYTVTVTDANGCTAATTRQIIVNSVTPVTNVTESSGTTANDGIICIGASATIGTTVAFNDYVWNTGATTSTITVSPTGTTTYTVTITDANVCSANATRTITVNPLPAAAFNIIETSGTANDGTICIGTSATLSTTLSFNNYLWNTGATTRSILVSPTTTTTYTITVTNSNGCTGSSTVTVNVSALPTTANAGPNQNLCNTTTATLAGNTPSIGTGNWAFVSGSGSGTVTTPSDPNSGVTGLTVGANNVFQWTVTNGACSSTSQVTIHIDAPVTSNAGPNQNLCNTTTATLAGNTPPGGASGAWTLISGSGTITTPSSPTSGVSGLATGDNVFLWFIINGTCSSSSQVTIHVDAPGTTANAGSNQNLCNVTTATLAGNTPSVGAGSWSVIAGGASVTSPTSESSGVTGLSIGDNIFQWSISNGACLTSSQATIHIDAPPTTSNAGSDQNLCNTTTTTLAGNNPSPNAGTWTLVGGSGTVTSPTDPASGVTGLAVGDNVFEWTITNGTCSSSSQVTIHVQAATTTADAGPDQTGASTCGLTTVTLAANDPSVGTGAWSIVSGSGGSFGNSSLYNSTFTGTAGGTYTVRWTITNSPCASSTSDVNITFNLNPTTADAGPDQTGTSTCGLTTVTLAANDPTVGTGAWSVVTGTGGSFGNSSLYNSTFTGTAGTAYTLRWTISNSPCTASTNDVDVTFNQYPVLSPTSNTACDGSPLVLSANPSLGVAPFTYSWSGPNGTIAPVSSSTITITSSVSAGDAGTYTVTAVDANGCTASPSSVVVEVHTTPSGALFANTNADFEATICEGANATLMILCGGEGTITGTLWDGVSTTLASYSGVQFEIDIPVTPTGTTVYYLQSMHDQYCAAKMVDIIGVDPVTVYVVPTPTPIITPSGATSFCSGGSVTLDAGVFDSYLWSDGSTNQTVNVTASGTYSVTVTDGNACSGTSSVTTVTVYTPPAPSITPSGPTSFCSGGSVDLDAGAGYASYLWSNGSTNQTITGITVSGTYSVTVTDVAHGCSGTSSIITITASGSITPTITPSGPTSFCSGGSVDLDAGAGYTSYLWSNGSTNQTINGITASGTYSVTVTDANGCSGSSSITTIIVYSNPTPTITPTGATSFCSGGSVDLDAGAGYTSYLWSNGSTNQTITNITANGTYSVTVTNANGCSGTSSVTTITVYSNPNPTITPSGATSFCLGGSVDLDAGAGYTSYLWSNGSTNQTINSITASGTYSVTVTDANGCSGTSSVTTITVYSNPTPSITPSGATSFCPDGSVDLDAGAGYTSYLWSNGSTNQIITNITASGTYSVTVTNANGCSGSSSVTTITVYSNPTPTITPSGATSFCSGGSINLDAGAGYTSYLWSNGTTNQTITNITTSGTYSVTVTNANGCSGTSSVTTITVYSNPTPAITPSGATSFCSGGSVDLDAGAGYTSYLWSNGSTNQTITNITTSGTYSVTVTDANGCSGTSSVTTITVYSNPIPTITPSGATTFCSGGTVDLDAGAGYASYLWSNGSTNQTITNITASGTYSVTVTNANGCSGSSSVTTITVYSNPTPTITPSGATSFCPSGSVDLDAGAGYTSYVWSNGSTNQTITGITASGTYSVTVTDANGCSGSSSVTTITVYSNPTPSITPSGATSFCLGGSVDLDAGAGYTSYVWSNGSTNQTITGITASGTYSVTVTDANSCSGSSSITTVTVNQTPGLSETHVNPTCNTETNGSIDLTVSGGASPYEFSWNGGATTEDVTGLTVGTYYVDVTDQNGCTATLNTTLTAPSCLNVSAGSNSPVCEGSDILLSTTSVSGGTSPYTYSWTGPNGTITPMANPTITSATPADAGTYSVTVTDAIGNTATANTTVIVNSIPSQADTILGPYVVCPGTQGVVYTAGNSVGATSFQWVLPPSGGVSIASVSGNTITIDFDNTWTNGPLTVIPQNSCGLAINTTMIELKSVPHSTSAIAGPTVVCAGTAGVVYSVNPMPLYASSYNWTVPSGVSINSGQGTTSINVNFTPTWTNGGFTVIATNTCGNSDLKSLGVKSIPNTAGTITGPAVVCPGTPGTYSILPAVAATSYTWAVPSGMTIATGQGTLSIEVTTNGSWTGGNVSVITANSCGAAAAKTLAVNSVNLPTPGTITAAPTGTVCPGATITYSIGLVSGATGYAWTLPAGASIVGNTTDNVVTISYTAGFTASGTLKVAATTSCGSSGQKSLTISRGAKPATPSVITGAAKVCPGDAFTYSVTPVSGVTYNWVTPTGGSINSGQGSNSVNVSYNGGLFVATDTLRVTAGNGCGSSAEKKLTMTRNTPSQPGTISVNITGAICPNSVRNYSVAPVANATGYLWTVPTGGSMTGQGTNAISVSYDDNLATGSVTVASTNNCGNSAARSLTVSRGAVAATPGVITGAIKVCPGDVINYSVPLVSGLTYNWLVPSGANITNQTVNQIVVNYTASFTASGSVSVTASNSCGASNPRNLTINLNNPTTPSLISGDNYGICASTTESYSVTEIAGMSYNWVFAVPGYSVSNLNASGSNANVTFPSTFTTASGALSVTATNGCGTSPLRNLTIYRAPSALAYITPTTSACVGIYTYSVNSVKGATSYAWSTTSGTAVSISVVNDTTANVTFNSIGTRNVTVKAFSACSNSVKSLSVVVGTTCKDAGIIIDGGDPETAISVYPNPATEQVLVSFNGHAFHEYHLAIVDMMGREVVVKNGTAMEGVNTVALDLSRVAKGYYLTHLVTGTSDKIVRLVVE